MSRNILLPDPLLSIPTVLLLSLSILVLYSSSPELALQQGIFALIGLVLFYFLSFVDFKSLDKIVVLGYLGIILLLIITFVIGFETRGSYRWISLGVVQLQPSELAKPIMILLLAHFWRKREASWSNLIKSFLIASPVLLLIFRQPDLGTTLSLLAIWGACLIGANLSFIKMLTMTLISLPIIYIGSFLLKDYQKQRILSFLSPSEDPLGTGYNVIQSTIAVGSGQFLGRGLGRGTQSRLQFLPEFRTDFVFASISEEFGFLGCLVVLMLYGTILGRMLRIVSQIKDRFGVVVIFGVLGMIFFQTVVNIGMNIGILPVTGITLPLLSYGGSSLIGTLISLGMVVSVVRYSPQRSNLEL